MAFDSFKRLFPEETADIIDAARADWGPCTPHTAMARFVARTDFDLMTELQRLLATFETFKRPFPEVTDLFKNVEAAVLATEEHRDEGFEGHVREAMSHYRLNHRRIRLGPRSFIGAPGTQALSDRRPRGPVDQLHRGRAAGEGG